jgi:outer membrane lipoprotein-sorting protein
VDLVAQDADKLIREVRQKMEQVNDYQAKGKLKTDVAFLKVPVSNVQVYFQKPNRFRIKKDGGISLLPKNGVSVNLNSLLMQEDYVAVAAGSTQIEGTPVQMVKLIPLSESGELVLTTLYIDEKLRLIRKAVSTTRDNGTYDMQLYYGRYASFGLPDRVLFSFNTKDYKLPKGVTFEYETGQQVPEKIKDRKGRVEIVYEQYQINKGLPVNTFR